MIRLTVLAALLCGACAVPVRVIQPSPATARAVPDVELPPDPIEFPEEGSDERQMICVQWGVLSDAGGESYPFRCITLLQLRDLLFAGDERGGSLDVAAEENR